MKANQLFNQINIDVEKAEIAYKYETDICHAKANLLAALLRAQGIPTGIRQGGKNEIY